MKRKLKLLTLVFLVITSITFFNSCEKEILTPCNCGVIANDGIDIDANYNLYYWLEIRNSCSGNKKKFYFDEDIWMDAYVGNDFCVTNVDSW